MADSYSQSFIHGSLIAMAKNWTKLAFLISQRIHILRPINPIKVHGMLATSFEAIFYFNLSNLKLTIFNSNQLCFIFNLYITLFNWLKQLRSLPSKCKFDARRVDDDRERSLLNGINKFAWLCATSWPLGWYARIQQGIFSFNMPSSPVLSKTHKALVLLCLTHQIWFAL
jgi:hypothetical protein